MSVKFALGVFLIGARARICCHIGHVHTHCATDLRYSHGERNREREQNHQNKTTELYFFPNDCSVLF